MPPNHPNRSRGNDPGANPLPEDIRALRERAELTQTAAAALVHTSCRTWQQWEAAKDTPDHRRMHPAFWALFKIRVEELAADRRLDSIPRFTDKPD